MAIRTSTEKINLWFDSEGDYLEVLFEIKAGYFRATADDRVMVRVDMDDRIIGFNVLGVSTIKNPLNVSLVPVEESEDSP